MLTSRFLRPYTRRLGFLNELRLTRIRRAMDDAAINKRVFHLWWHPHNFDKDLEGNLAFLQQVFDHYSFLNRRHGLRSMNMAELCEAAEVAIRR